MGPQAKIQQTVQGRGRSSPVLFIVLSLLIKAPIKRVDMMFRFLIELFLPINSIVSLHVL